MVAMNLLRGTGQTADYVLTGTWGTKAFKSAARGTARAVWDARRIITHICRPRRS